MKKTYKKPEIEIVQVNVEAPLLQESYGDETGWTPANDNNNLMA